MPKGVEVKRLANGLLFYEVKQACSFEKPAPQTFGEGRFEGGMYEVIVSKTPLKEGRYGKILHLDGDKVPQSAVFRFRQEGDEIRRFGGGTKSLKKFFNEEKVAVEEREYIPLIAEKEGTCVYAVCGWEISENVKCDENTKKILYVGIGKKKYQGEKL